MNPQCIEIQIVRAIGEQRTGYQMFIEVDGEQVHGDRTGKRPYDSVSDAITSARHAVNGFLKGERS